MTRVLVTGGTGVLGREVARRLAGGSAVRVMSRRGPPVDLVDLVDAAPPTEWAIADLATGVGLAAALAGVDTIVHAATDATISLTNLFGGGRVDVAGTKLLLEHARAAGVSHVVYISIVGVDQVPYIYYQRKLAAEEQVRTGGVPWTILRATQFHPFVDRFLRLVGRAPVLAIPTDFQLQPVDAGEVADRLCDAVEAGPRGRLADFGGPEVRPLGNLAAAWQRARGERRHIMHLPLLGRIAAAIEEGRLTSPYGERGMLTWEDWLQGNVAGAGV